MKDSGFWVLNSVPDAQLKRALSDLLASGSRTEARVIAHLAEVEERRLHLRDGSESLYAHCIHTLRLSNSEAFHRITAARIARRFPVVFTLLEQRALHLTAVCLLRDYLTPENHRELLEAAAHKTKAQVEELIAHRFPRPDVESRIRKLPAPRSASALTRPRDSQPCDSQPCDSQPRDSQPRDSQPRDSQPCDSQPCDSQPRDSQPCDSQPRDSQPCATETTPKVALCSNVPALRASVTAGGDAPFATGEATSGTAVPSGTEPRESLTPVKLGSTATAERPSRPPPDPRKMPRPRPIEPLSEARYRIQLNASSALKGKLDRLRDLTSHVNPTGDIAVIIERALDLAIEHDETRRFAKTKRPRRSVPQRRPGVQRQPELTATPPAELPRSVVADGAAAQQRHERKHIANAVVREVVARDDARCTYVSAGGCRCTALAFLQIHHEQSWARGGADTVDNLRILCASHNRLLAEQEFGARHVARRVREQRIQRHERRTQSLAGDDPTSSPSD